jgi:hypothetical protein
MTKQKQDKIVYSIMKKSKSKNLNIECNIDIDNYLSNNIVQYYDLKTFDNKANNIALMLESRIFPYTELLLRQFSRFLPDTFLIYIYVTDNIYNEYIQLSKLLNNNIIIKLLPAQYKLTSVNDYNNIMLNISFWKLFTKYTHILIFNSDTMIYRNGINSFLQYDYIGAPWSNTHNILVGGTGGLSLRNINAMIYCLQNKNKVIIPDNILSNKNIIKYDTYFEDIFYSYAMNQFNYKVADEKTASLFSIEESMHNIQTFGSYQLNKYNTILHKYLLLNSLCPYQNYNSFNLSGHRHGWKIVDNKLSKLFMNKKILFLSYADLEYIVKNFSCNKKEWVGIFHLTPVNTNKYFKEFDINLLKVNINFLHDIQYCRGIFVLSEFLKKEVKELLNMIGYPNILVEVLYHPIVFNNLKFNSSIIDIYSKKIK